MTALDDTSSADLTAADVAWDIDSIIPAGSSVFIICSTRATAVPMLTPTGVPEMVSLRSRLNRG